MAFIHSVSRFGCLPVGYKPYEPRIAGQSRPYTQVFVRKFLSEKKTIKAWQNMRAIVE